MQVLFFHILLVHLTEIIMSVTNLKRELADLSSRGRAGCVAGIIVSEYMWERLEAHFGGDFNGRIGISGVQGNRMIRYEFYVLKSPTFPKERIGSGYFFVPFSEEDYRARILGHESDGTLVPRSREIRLDEVKELNPVTGECWVSDRRIGLADFSRLIVAIETGCLLGKSVREQASHFWYWGFTFRRPEEIVWLKHPERYDYHRADLKSAVGRLLMRRTEVDGATFFDILGIAINGRGQIVEVLNPKMRYVDLEKFLNLAKWYFLPDEITDFLAQFGIEIDPNNLELDPLYEAWGHQVDYEAIGRLKKYVSSSKIDGPWDLHSLSGMFLGSRAVEYRLSFCDRVQGPEWEKIETEHYPPGWDGWPDTSHERGLKSFAQAWANA